MRRAKAWLLTLAFALDGCGAVGQLHYTGALPGCGLATATLTQHGDAFVFTPGDGVLMISGAVAADGSFTGALNTQPAGKPPFLLSVHGRIGVEQATLDYTTPRCTAHATFARVHPPLF